jgi:hypothetical protein
MRNTENKTNLNSPYRGLGGTPSGDRESLFIGNNPVIAGNQEVKGEYVQIDGEKYYRINGYDNMQPFFISIASDSNHWMYISSMGGLTCGRVNPNFALFPYYTDDKINESEETTGSKTIFHVRKDGKTFLWEPFSHRHQGIYNIERSIAKNTIGNKILFIETNHDLGLTFSYSWMSSEKFGWVKKSNLKNDTEKAIDLFLVDGLQNVLPSGVDKDTQVGYSTLVDGYKKTELVENTGLVLFRMESILVDKAEPSESLRANTVWNYGLDNPFYLLSSKQLNAIRMGDKPQPENESKGVRGAIFACADENLAAYAIMHWYFVAEVNLDIASINNLVYQLQHTEDLAQEIEVDVVKGTESLNSIIEQADGVQHTADEGGMARHYANVLYNVMRGGIYAEEYTIDTEFFGKHVWTFNREVYGKHHQFIASLPRKINYFELEKLVISQNDHNLYRIYQEYLPLTFSRRHGDPSRPWNHFSINIKDDHGNKVLSFQGNWRDIFQNWEALSLSYPGFINGIISKFLNATTADGYNAYRITDKGIEWEEIEPGNPWSNIGYWGDHQIIYLEKLLEISYNHSPEHLLTWLNKEMFAYANVPYRLKLYAEIVADPKNSILFDHQLHKALLQREKEFGADAKLIHDRNNNVLLVTFTEKLLATLLAKLSNFIPEAGIWMNTQRPEWNDANNALVGSGVSMVTLYYMRRFVNFARNLYKQSSLQKFTVSAEMFDFFNQIATTFTTHSGELEKGFNDVQRRNITDELGNAGSNYRMLIYNGFSQNKEQISKSYLMSFFDLTLHYLDQSIGVNKRSDKMYHAYNLVTFTDNKLSIRHLYEMLEGQVSVLSAGKLNANEVIDLLDGLRRSSLYRPDQNSYILYPNKKLPLLLDKNNIPDEEMKQSRLLSEMMRKGDYRIVTTDLKGQYHFHSDFNNVGFLRNKLETVKADYQTSDSELKSVENLYEKVFDHQSFTGRSGTFYKYEGLGCIYWHMVSKLVLAIAENLQRFHEENVDKTTLDKLTDYYYEVKAGIGAHKSPKEFGAFPFDPYSHTPTMAGVQQPGMTGLVKEDITSRFYELGIVIEDGKLKIRPDFLNRNEFLSADAENEFSHLKFTYCSVPFEYQLNGKSGIEVLWQNGKSESFDEYTLNAELSRTVFNRDKNIKGIIVNFKPLN